MAWRRQRGHRWSDSPDATRTAGSPAAPSVQDQYFMPPYLAPPPGYQPPRPPTCHKEEEADWQGIPHLRNIGPEEEARILSRTGPAYVVVHGVPAHRKRLLEDTVKPVPGYEATHFYNPQTSQTGMAVLVFADHTAAVKGFNELFHCFSASSVGKRRPERILLVQQQGALPPCERVARLKAFQEPSPKHQG
ncbi:g6785 [Coccomyxa elongata]